MKSARGTSHDYFLYHCNSVGKMKSLVLLITISSCIICKWSVVNGFAPPPSFLSSVSSTTHNKNNIICTRLQSTPEPLATEGDWSAYLDTDTTGYVYYFNSVTGESVWEPPTSTFPSVDASTSTSNDNNDVVEQQSREERKAERKRRREERAKEGGGGGLFGIFGSSGGDDTKEPKKSKTEQLTDLQEIANNNEFLSELDSVIAEAEEAISIADKVKEAPAKNKGGFFSSLGFISGKEAIDEVETLIADVEERTSKVADSGGGMFSGLNFGARAASPKVEEPTIDDNKDDKEEEEEPWVEGLKNLFKKTFDTFIPPQTKMTPEKKVVAVDEKPKEQKAKVADSDFLDVM